MSHTTSHNVLSPFTKNRQPTSMCMWAFELNHSRTAPRAKRLVRDGSSSATPAPTRISTTAPEKGVEPPCSSPETKAPPCSKAPPDNAPEPTLPAVSQRSSPRWSPAYAAMTSEMAGRVDDPPKPRGFEGPNLVPQQSPPETLCPRKTPATPAAPRQQTETAAMTGLRQERAELPQLLRAWQGSPSKKTQGAPPPCSSRATHVLSNRPVSTP